MKWIPLNMWRRISTICFFLVVSVLVAGCGGSASQDDATPDGEREQTQSTEDESSSDVDVPSGESSSPESPNVPSDPVLDDSTNTNNESSSDATNDEPPETEGSDSPSNETVDQSIVPEEVTPEESETEAGNISSADSTSGSSNEPEEITPAPQSLEFAISSGHKSQALDGYVEVPAWARDFQNSTNGSNLQFIVDLKSRADMFVQTPTVSYPSGTLRYEAKPSAEGRAIIAMQLVDRDTGVKSAVRIGTFRIEPAPAAVNNAPSFKNLGNQTVDADSGAFALSGWAYDVSDGDDSTQVLNFEIVSNSNPELFEVQPSVSVPSGTLRFTPKAGESGAADISIRLKDNGGVANGGMDVSAVVELGILIEENTPLASITVGSVNGNTASYNAIAYFELVLDSQPQSDVVIPVSSSDTSEGVSSVSSLTFTPENWNQSQLVVVKGRNRNVVDGIQDYRVVLGTVQSNDPDYHGLDPDDVLMKGIILTLFSPTDLLDFIPGIEQKIGVSENYTGNKRLSYSLVEKPNGMEIGLSSGVISWMPSDSTRGNTYSVKVRVTDGILASETTFDVTVAIGTKLNTAIDGNIVTVTEPESNLDGLWVRIIDNSISANNIELVSVPSISVKNIPRIVTPITDFFTIKEPIDGEIKVKLPLSQLPADIDLLNVRLYSLTTAVGYGGTFWSPVSLGTEIYEKLGEPVIEITLLGLDSVFFVGYENLKVESESNSAPKSNRLEKRSDKSGVNCLPTQTMDGSSNYMLQHCTHISNRDIEIEVKGFGESASATRWDGTSIEDLITWLVEAQTGLDVLSLDYDNKFIVDIHNIDLNDDGVVDESIFGYVSSNNDENYSVLHLNDIDANKSLMRGTVVHEYFHHAQSRNIANKDLLIKDDAGLWFIEGTARWFEDELYDDSNTYVEKEYQGENILTVGLDKDAGKYFNDDSEDGYPEKKYDRPYQRFSFIKLLSSKCDGFDNVFKNLSSVDNSLVDPSGIENLVAELEGASCSFGNHLGEGKSSSLESALLYYQYATQYKNKVSLLDSNEDDSDFKFVGTPYQYEQSDWGEVSEVASTGSIDISKIEESGIPAFGAFSIKVKSDWLTNADLDEGYEAVLNVRSSIAITVSILSEHSSFIGNSTLDGIQHHHFRTDESTEYVFTQDELVDFFITLVNPSDIHADITSLSFEVRKTSDNLNIDTDKDGVNDTADPAITDPCVPNLDNDACYATATEISVSASTVITVDQEVVFTIKGEDLPLGMIVTPEGSEACTVIGERSSSVQTHRCVPRLAGSSINLNMVGRIDGAPLQGTPVSITVNTGIVPPVVPPTTPANVTALINNAGNIEVSWDNVAGATSHNVYISQDDFESTEARGVRKVPDPDNVSPFVFDNAFVGTTYYFGITSVVSDVESALSNVVGALIREVEKPSAPTGLVVLSDESSINFDWESVSGATGYNVYVSGNSGITIGGSGVRATLDISSTRYSFNTTVNDTFYFAVTSIVRGVESPLSNEVSGSIQQPAPEVDVDGDGTFASTDPNDNVPCIPNRDLEICRAFGTVSDIKFSPESPVAGDNITFTVLGSYLPDDLLLEISASSQCQYQGINERNFEAQQFFCPSVTPNGTTGSDLSVRVGRHSGRELGFKSVPFSAPVPVAQLTGLSTSSETLRVGEPVVFSITGENLPNTISVSLQGTSNCQITSRSDSQVLVTCSPEEAGTKTLFIAPESGQSAIAGNIVRSFEVLPAHVPVVAPTGLAVEQIGSDFEITWNSVAGAEDYSVYISSLAVIPISEIGNSGFSSSGGRSFVYKNRPGFDVFYVAVTAVIDDRESELGEIVRVDVETAPLNPPSNVVASGKADRIIVSWTEVSDATSYKVYISNNYYFDEGDVDNTDEYSASTSPFTITSNLEEGTQYYIAVSAIRDESESSLSAKVSARLLELETPDSVVTGVSPLTATVGEEVVFTITGTELPSTIAVSLEGTDNCEVENGSSTSVVVTCTPQTAGSQNLYVADVPGGNALENTPRTITVAEEVIPEPSVTSVSPLVVTAGEDALFTIKGVNLPEDMVVQLEENSNCVLRGEANSSEQVFLCEAIQSSKNTLTLAIGESSGKEISGSPLEIAITQETSDYGNLTSISNATGTNIQLAGAPNWANHDLSYDGRIAVFASAGGQIYLHDKEFTGQLIRVTSSSNGSEGNAISSDPQVSGNGEFVVFTSRASNLVDIGTDSNTLYNIFLYDVESRTTKLLSRKYGTLSESADNSSTNPVIDYSGENIYFSSAADDLTVSGRRSVKEIYHYKRTTDSLRQLDGLSSSGATLIPVALTSDGFNLLYTQSFIQIPVRVFRFNVSTDSVTEVPGIQGFDMSSDGNDVLVDRYNGSGRSIYIHSIDSGADILLSSDSYHARSSPSSMNNDANKVVFYSTVDLNPNNATNSNGFLYRAPNVIEADRFYYQISDDGNVVSYIENNLLFTTSFNNVINASD